MKNIFLGTLFSLLVFSAKATVYNPPAYEFRADELVGKIDNQDIYVRFNESCCLSGQTDLGAEASWTHSQTNKTVTHDLFNGNVGGKRNMATAAIYKNYLILSWQANYGRFDIGQTWYEWHWLQFDNVKQSFFGNRGSCSTNLDKDNDQIPALKKEFANALKEERTQDALDFLRKIVVSKHFSSYYQRYDFEQKNPPAEQLQLIETERQSIDKQVRATDPDFKKIGAKICHFIHNSPLQQWINSNKEDEQYASESEDEHHTDKRIVPLGDFGFYLQQTGYLEEAIPILKKTLELSPYRAVTQLNLADAYWDLGQTREAKKAYKAYVEGVKKTSQTQEALERARTRISSPSAKKIDSVWLCPQRLLRETTRKNFATKVKQYLNEGGDPNTYFADDGNSLIRSLVDEAIDISDLKTLDLLITQGGKVTKNKVFQYAPYSNLPPLIRALKIESSKEKTAMIKLLLKNSALEGLEKDAIRFNYFDRNKIQITRLLLEAGAKADLKSLISPVFSETTREFWEMILNHDKTSAENLKTMSDTGFTLLHLATEARIPSLMTLLIKRGVDLNALTPSKMTAKDFTERFHEKELIAALGPKALTALELAQKNPQKFAHEKKKFDHVPKAIIDLIHEREKTNNKNGEQKSCPANSLPKYFKNHDNV